VAGQPGMDAWWLRLSQLAGARLGLTSHGWGPCYPVQRLPIPSIIVMIRSMTSSAPAPMLPSRVSRI